MMMTTIRRSTAVLVLIATLALPVAAAPARGSEAPPPLAFTDRLAAWLGELWSALVEAGPAGLDRVRAAGDQGSTIDPNGAEGAGDIGSGIDPDGVAGEGDKGLTIDPDG